MPLNLYLDFDGVLHHCDVMNKPDKPPSLDARLGVLFEHAPRLAQALEPFPDVRIVLSTSWVRERSFSFAKRRLPATLQKRVIGATFHSAMQHVDAFIDPGYSSYRFRCAFDRLTRYQAIKNDAYRRQQPNWIAIDDDTEGWREVDACRLVATDGARGLADAAALGDLQAKLAKYTTS